MGKTGKKIITKKINTPHQLLGNILRISIPGLAKRRRGPRLAAVGILLAAHVKVSPAGDIAGAGDAAGVGLEEVGLVEGRAVGDAGEDEEEEEEEGGGGEEETSEA